MSMNLFKRILALVALAAAPMLSHALTTVYVMPCDTGFDSALTATCPANNSYNGLSRYPGKLDDGVTTNAAYGPKRDLASFSMSGYAAGGLNVLFSKGSYWAHASGTIAPNYSAAAASGELIIGFYTPPQGCGGCGKPIIKWPGTAANDEGIYLNGQNYVTVTGLDLRGGYYNAGTVTAGVDYNNGGTKDGINTYTASSHVHIVGNRIEGFAHGISVNVDPPSGIATDWTVSGNYIVNNSGQGFYGGTSDLLLENNDFVQNGFFRQNFDHNIYLDGPAAAGAGVSRVTVRFNRLSKGNDNGAGCNATNFVVHKWVGWLTIENNVIEEANAFPGCYGIQVNAYTDTSPSGFFGLTIRGNRLRNVGSTGISCGACYGAVIENNAVEWTYNNTNVTTKVGIQSPDWGSLVGGTPNAGDRADGNVMIRNNFIYIAYADAFSEAIRFGTSGVTGDQAVSNLIVFPSTASASAKCFQTYGKSRATFGTGFGFNRCYRVGGVNVWSDQYSTLAAAQAAGWDASSLNTDPGLSGTPAAGSGYAGACTSGCGTGHPTLSSTIGIDNKNVTPGTREIGPEVSGTVKIGPATPTWKR